MVDPIDEYVI